MATKRVVILASLLLTLSVSGCTRPQETDQDRLRRQAAEDARQIRHDAQNASVEAQKAAREAGREAHAIVSGVKQGWQEGAPSGSEVSRLDLNAASPAELSALPGISPLTAKKIVRKRPYDAPEDLVTRGLLTQAQYDRVSGRLKVHDSQ